MCTHWTYDRRLCGLSFSMIGEYYKPQKPKWPLHKASEARWSSNKETNETEPWEPQDWAESRIASVACWLFFWTSNFSSVLVANGWAFLPRLDFKPRVPQSTARRAAHPGNASTLQNFGTRAKIWVLGLGPGHQKRMVPTAICGLTRDLYLQGLNNASYCGSSRFARASLGTV